MVIAEPRIYQLLMKLRERGGALVRDSDCTEEQLAMAKHEDRYTEDSDGHGYVWMPVKWRMT